MVSSSRNEEEIFDAVRKCWVRATPEEKVRQFWLRQMIECLDFPKELIVVEKELKELPHLRSREVPGRRLDILCYGKGILPEHPLYPLLMIECKQSRPSSAAMDQVIGYNAFVGACFVAVAGGREIQMGYFHKEKEKYVFGTGLPSYQELIQWTKR